MSRKTVMPFEPFAKRTPSSDTPKAKPEKKRYVFSFWITSWISSLTYRLYQEKMHRIYDKKIKQVSLLHHLFSKAVTFSAKRLSKRYGVSMHMNVAPSYQHQRVGIRLLDSLKEDCRSFGAKGLFLVTRNRNTTGYPFYLHNGFQEGRDFLFGSLALVYPLADKGSE
jgi:GNAT superfamily N-acetyltransferase